MKNRIRAMIGAAPERPGRLILLNGLPSSGKTASAQAVQAVSEEPVYHRRTSCSSLGRGRLRRDAVAGRDASRRRLSHQGSRFLAIGASLGGDAVLCGQLRICSLALPYERDDIDARKTKRSADELAAFAADWIGEILRLRRCSSMTAATTERSQSGGPACVP
jgi:hypothetical protein